jgi:polysaccharide export outer membrane protein
MKDSFLPFFRLVLVSAILVLFISSCRTQKSLPYNYLENVADTSIQNTVKIPELTIQKGDLLSIQIYSATTHPETDALYNLPNFGGISPSGSSGGTGSAVISGFLVDANGNIEYPRIGTIHVEGLKKSDLADLIKKRINQPEPQLENPTVIVRFLNYKITVLGEVQKPGSYNIPGERVTVLEALGLAGDIAVYGKRNTVKIIREVNGNREIGTIDLTSKDFFESPYYNLLQNDIVIVEAKRAKVRQADTQEVSQRISLALGIITSIALIYNVFK